jgi:flagellar biosynthesis/type III secretory pathway chaperone
MSVVDEIRSVLKEEQELLLAGNFVALEALVERKSRLTETLAARMPTLPRDGVAELLEQAGRNDALLGAARRGLSAALAQLRQLSSAREQTTYSSDGQRRSLFRTPSSVAEKY